MWPRAERAGLWSLEHHRWSVFCSVPSIPGFASHSPPNSPSGQCFIQFCAGLPVAQDLFLLLTVKRKVAYISTLKRIYFPLSVSLGKWFQEFGFQPLQFIVSSSIIYYYSFILLYFNHITRLHYAILCYAILLVS